MTFAPFRTVAVVALVALLCSGCFYSREIAQTRRDLERAYPEAEFDREMMVNLGPLSIRTARWILHWMDEDDDVAMARSYLGEVRRVKVGLYKTEFLPDLGDFDPPALRRFRQDGWELAVQVHEDDEAVWLFYKPGRRGIRDLYAVVLTEEELVLARLRGRLDRLVRRALEDHAPWRDEGFLSGMDRQ